ncbi:MAG: sigma-70 family RNA polymerase sigma factor [Actinomycetota bacterium]|nr:sigma-70 family RNA polymerase sigma factor [Actinomycetota bacterium]
MRNRVFVSYPPSGHGLVNALRARLASELGDTLQVIDASSLDDDAPYPVALHRALRETVAALILIDERQLTTERDARRTEIAVCLAAEPEVAVLPVLMDGATLDEARGELGRVLRRLGQRVALTVRSDHLDADLDPILRRLRGRLSHEREASAPAPLGATAGEHRVPAALARTDGSMLPLDDDLEADLVDAARTDPEAFAQLYRHHLPGVHAYAYRRTRSREVAEDATAATFETAYRELDQLTPEPGAFGRWLFQIAAREVSRHPAVRDGGGEGPPTGSDAGPIAGVRDAVGNGATGAPTRTEVESWLTAMSRLRPYEQKAIRVGYLSGLAPAEAAETMGLSADAMELTLGRAIEALRRTLGEQREIDGG